MDQQHRCLSDSRLAAFASDLCGEASLLSVRRRVDECSHCAELAVAAVGSASGRKTGRSIGPLILQPGLVVSGRYVVRGCLGRGGSGEVHVADDRVLGKTVAIKTLNAVLASGPGYLELLRAEVALAHRVTHQNVCRIFDCGVDENFGGDAPLCYLTMEYLPGTTLRQALREAGRFEPARAMRLWRQIVDGVAAAHRVGIVHRDLKPENVVLVRQSDVERAVILDFGLATALREPFTIPEGRFVGTPRYAAPEQVKGVRATPASDVYAAALIMLEMLTGSPTPTTRVAEWKLRKVLSRATRESPHDRFADALALATALQPPTFRSTALSRMLAASLLVACASAVVAYAYLRRDVRSPIRRVVESAPMARAPSPQALRPGAPAPAPVPFSASSASSLHSKPRKKPKLDTAVGPPSAPAEHATDRAAVPSTPQREAPDELVRHVTFSAPADGPKGDASAMLPDPFLADPFRKRRSANQVQR